MCIPLRYLLQVSCIFVYVFLLNSSIYSQDSLRNSTQTIILNDSFDYDETLLLFKNLNLQDFEDPHVYLSDSNSIIRNQILFKNLDDSDYRGYSLSLKYYSDDNLKIAYQPTLEKTYLLSSKQGFLDSLAYFNKTSSLIGEPLNLVKSSEKLFATNPELVEFVWSEIPEPHRTITDRKYLSKRSAEEGIALLLDYDNYETKKQLEKRVRKEGPWYTGGTESLQFAQTHLSNWTKGGESTISLQSDLILKADYKQGNVEWENYIRQKLGIISSESDPARINTDQIELFNKYGLKASEKWYYSLVSNFKSQLFTVDGDEGEKAVSSLLAPAYITFSLGMDYKPNENFTLLFSPLSTKFTYVMDTVKVDQTRYSISEDKKSANNTGFSMLNTFVWDISTEFKLVSNLDAFVDYRIAQNFYQVDWELIFDMRINRYLSTRINTQLRYFTNESDKLQFREYFSVSFNYEF
ncbi:DUF3078 domain-containing protein [Saccharicrinis aurantiacus]|uniref:DUF3078 domain-containing protein n=1 Tax=Saccharicrinis aurantiacus TaxID=1849719 RepID=UPI000837CE6A|nr:DUF3078 domain-containing protein [Saccharicrinis aurantiacus]